MNPSILHMTRKSGALLLGLTLLATPASAQDRDRFGVTSPSGLVALPDFFVTAHVDVPNMANGIPLISKADGPLVVGGWAFECRSGLQPATQRTGDLAVSLMDVNTGAQPSYTVRTVTGDRADVGRYFRFFCPALGNTAGFSLLVDLTNVPPGMYKFSVLADAFDYAGRLAWYQPKPITIIITN